MLDTDTKRRIDTARDILVGKVPDPKSQVEQITIALIYKFMDDIDAQSEELGGQRTFFAGEFARYGWARLMRPGIGGHEMLNLYAEAIGRMPENPGIPPLFRDIFNNAFLPYRDPETLRAFLKIIDEFNYDHSERLGDAFEYLLSVLGSQGDAGQFRTPRHIIDFIVAIIDPKKDEVILDPACGTAGFLISSYKHILAANRDADGNSTLTPDDSKRLANNFQGYDISPDMVRLSLVNMYLHGFVDPRIVEYDTLTSEDLWNDFADVILANPPFMSPKGGIRPHNHFSVQSRRSEVLFVDYMAEHLNPAGRAGIIVPEGIIFQNQKAHRQLRKMLVEDYLVAVVSLPGGVFKPYSGVKTSILILDKALARKTEGIAFFKVENDGFDLGDQRRPISENDLPAVQSELSEYLRRLRSGQPLDDFQPEMGLVASKAKVAEDGDYNLSGERYREVSADRSKYDWVSLGNVLLDKPQYGSGARKAPYNGKLRYVRITDITDSGELKNDDAVSPSKVEPEKFLEPGDLLIARSGSVGRTYLHGDLPGTYQYAGYLIRFRINPDRAITEYVYQVTRSHSWHEWIRSNSKTGTLTNINAKQYSSFRFPLPPLGVQREIVAEIEGYQKVIDGARAVVDNYRPQIAIDPEWPMVEVQELAKPQYGFTASAQECGDARFIRITDISEDGLLSFREPKFMTMTDQSEQSLLSRGDILVARTGATYGKTMLFDGDYPAVFASYLIRLRFPPDKVDPYYYWAFAQSGSYWNQAKSLMTGGGQPQFNGNAIKQIQLPLPSLETQQAIVAEIEAERTLVNANREIITRFEQKIQDTMGRVWGE